MKENMFNLETAIKKWRQQMIAGGIKTPEFLDELENHLREDVAQQICAGTEMKEAFENAVRCIGEANALKMEFAKANRRTLAEWLKAKLDELLPRGPVPMPELGDFSAAAQQTLALAREEAPRLHHDFIGTEHVLLGLAQSQSGALPKVMQRLGVNRENVRTEIEKWIGLGQPATRIPAKIPFTPRAKRALSLAAKEAKSFGRPDIGAEHIFLGLLLEGHGVAALVLKNLGVDAEKTRVEIRRALAGS